MLRLYINDISIKKILGNTLNVGSVVSQRMEKRGGIRERLPKGTMKLLGKWIHSLS